MRRLGETLRVHKDFWGNLVSLKMGKIKEEGVGEVQKIIDIVTSGVEIGGAFGGEKETGGAGMKEKKGS